MRATPPPRAANALATRHSAFARIALLASGDAYIFMVFALLGLEQHHAALPTGLGDAFGAWVMTAAPFALGWFLVAPWLGAFRQARTATVARMLRTTLLAWLAAWPATLVLRWAFTGRVPPVSFAAVILLANAVLLGLQRSAVVFFERRRGWRQAPQARASRYPLKR